MIAINMEMPKNCLDCPVRNYKDDEGNRCDLTGLYNRDDCCPLVEIQEPKTGHWIDTDEWRETVDGFEQWGYFRKCSKCGYVFKFLEIDNFCPNCGAEMAESDASIELDV